MYEFIIRIMISEMKYKISLIAIIIVIVCLLIFNDTIREEIKSMVVSTPQSAICVFEQQGSSRITGTIKFTEDLIEHVTVIYVKLQNVPTGIHAIHIHENGHVIHPGKHYNPHGTQHGDIGEGHVGDLGNIVANEKGEVVQKIISKDIKLKGPYAIQGRLLTIRTEADDLSTGENGDVAATAIIGHMNHTQV